MKKEFEFKYKDRKFFITKKEGSDEECFSIDVDNLQFDIKKFYEGLFIDIDEYIEMEIVDDCNFPEDGDLIIRKKAKHVFDSVKEITQEICLKLNQQCFSEEPSELE